MKRTLFIGMLGLSVLMSGYAQQGEGVRKGRIVREPLVHDPVMAKRRGYHIIFIPLDTTFRLSRRKTYPNGLSGTVFFRLLLSGLWIVSRDMKVIRGRRTSFIIRGIIISFILVPLSVKIPQPLAMPIAGL